MRNLITNMFTDNFCTQFSGDDVLTEGVSHPVITSAPEDKTLMTTEQNITRVLQASDNGKEIKCIADHPGLDERKRMRSVKLIVQCTYIVIKLI